MAYGRTRATGTRHKGSRQGRKPLRTARPDRDDPYGSRHLRAPTHWTFTGNGNYDGRWQHSQRSPSPRPNATIVVNGYTGVYDGAAHGATGSATGVGSVSLAGLNLGASFTGVPGGTAHWTFTDATGNYNNKSGDVAIVITKATLTVKADAKTKVYDGAPFSAFTATVTGFVNYETQQVVTGAPAFSTAPVSPAVKPGTYTIKPAQGTLAAANYSFAVENGDAQHQLRHLQQQPAVPATSSCRRSTVTARASTTARAAAPIPVKFRVCDAAGKPISDSSLVFATVDQHVDDGERGAWHRERRERGRHHRHPDVAFRWTGQEWIFNMADLEPHGRLDLQVPGQPARRSTGHVPAGRQVAADGE